MSAAVKVLPNVCSRKRAESKLADYDLRREYGYKNQAIASRAGVRLATGMNIRDLRRWLAETA